MTYRGQLINDFVAVIFRVDTVATEAVPGGGFDKEFGEAIPVADGTQVGASSRREEVDPLRIPVQLDRDIKWHYENAKRAGLKIEADIVLIMMMEDLENMGMVDANGKIALNKGDRLEQIETTAGKVQDKYENPPGIFITSHQKAGYGLDVINPPEINLLYVYVAYRETSGATE